MCPGNRHAGGGEGGGAGCSGPTGSASCCGALDFTTLWMKWLSDSLSSLLLDD